MNDMTLLTAYHQAASFIHSGEGNVKSGLKD